MTIKKVNQLVSGALIALMMGLSMLPFVTSMVSAQDQTGGSGLRIPPGPIPLEIAPGEIESFELTVRNITPSPLDVTMEVNDFESNGVDGNPKVVFNENADPNNPFSLRPYVEGPTSFSLDVDEERTLTYTISLPNDAAAGSRYGLFRFLPKSADGSGEGVTLSASLGTIIIANTPGDAVELVALRDMTVNKQVEDPEQGTIQQSSSLFESAPDNIIVKLANEGSTFVQPFGSVQVKNWSGDVVFEYEFNAAQDDRPGILPQSEREFKKSLENISGYGKYTVEANISYGDGTNIIPATLTFWVIPWKILLLVLIVIVVLIIAFTRGMRLYKKRILNGSKREKSVKK